MPNISAFPPSGKSRKLGAFESFALSALAPSMAVVFTNPFDVVKVRLQLNGENAGKLSASAASGTPPPPTAKVYKGSIDCIVKTLRHEGFSALQKGLTPAILRESSKNIFRLGMYEPIMSVLHPAADPPTPAPGWKRVLAGSLCGMMGAVSCNPFELVKTRLQSASKSSSSAVGTQHRYTGVVNGLASIVREDGFIGLYRGSTLSMARSVLGSGSNLWAYTTAKDFLLAHRWEDNIWLDIVAGTYSGFVSVTCMNPVDVLRTRYYNQKYDANGKGAMYSSGWDTFRKVMKHEGFFALYKGYASHCIRSSHFCLTFVFLGMLRRGLLSFYDDQDLKEAFKTLDINGDGRLSRSELVKALVQYFPPSQVNLRGEQGNYEAIIDSYASRVLEKADRDRSGDLVLGEFRQCSAEVLKILHERKVREAFEWFNRTPHLGGGISRADLEQVVRETLTRHPTVPEEQYEDMVRRHAAALMSCADSNGDGSISYAEFERAVGSLDDVQKNKVLQRWMELFVGEDN